MCKSESPVSSSSKQKSPNSSSMNNKTKKDINEKIKNQKNNSNNNTSTFCTNTMSKRRGKRVKQNQLLPNKNSSKHVQHDHQNDDENVTKTKQKIKTGSCSRHEGDSHSGGLDSLLPSLIAAIVIGIGLLAKMGFRGRATVAGIDLGTTNSVICVQEQSQGSEVGQINCIPDPYNNSPIIPSVISILDPNHYSKTKQFKKKGDLGYGLQPSPSYVLVGTAAKARIDTHPHHTLYHAKRVLGLTYDDVAVKEFQNEVEFHVVSSSNRNSNHDDDNNNHDHEENEELNKYDDENTIVFEVPFHSSSVSIPPHQVGSYVINHLMEITAKYLGHDNIKSAVIAVPAKFDQRQRQETVLAFQNVGVKVARILEEPVAAALAYGLQKKANVDYIIVYDFGGGTLDVSVLQVFDGGYVEVIGNDGDNRLGGADFDAAVAHSMVELNDRYGAKIIDKIAKVLLEIEQNIDKNESLKDEDVLEESLVLQCPKLVETPLCSFSSFHTMGEKMKIDLSSLATGRNGVVSRKCLGIPLNVDFTSTNIADFCTVLEPIEFKLSTEQYNSACESLFERSISPVDRILGELDLTVNDIDEVVMVGGTTRMPQIREMVKKALQVEELNTSIDPDLTVAYGAASVID